MARILILLILVLFAGAVEANRTWYVRSAELPDGTDLNYNSEDGTDFDNAWDGLVDIDQSALNPGDKVMICGEHIGNGSVVETYSTSGTEDLPIIYDGNCADRGSLGAIKTWRWRCEADADWTHNGDGSYTSTANSCTSGPTGSAETAWVYEEGEQTNKGSTVTGADADGTYYCDTGTGVCTWKPACETGTPLPCYDLLVGGRDDFINITGDHITFQNLSLSYGYQNGWVKTSGDYTTYINIEARGSNGPVFRNGDTSVNYLTMKNIRCWDVRFCLDMQDISLSASHWNIDGFSVRDNSERVNTSGGDDHGIGFRGQITDSQFRNLECRDWQGECFLFYFDDTNQFGNNLFDGVYCENISGNANDSAACIEIGGENCNSTTHYDSGIIYNNLFKNIYALDVEDTTGTDEWGFRYKWIGASGGKEAVVLENSWFDNAPIQVSGIGTLHSQSGGNCSGTANANPGGITLRRTYIGSGGFNVSTTPGTSTDYSGVIMHDNTYGDGYTIDFANPSGSSATCTANGGTQNGNVCEGLKLRGFQRMYGKDQGSREIP